MTERVLLIDDHPAVRRGMSQLLAELGWEVVGECGSLAQARILSKKVFWTMAILDLTLPDGHGVDFLSELRAAGESRPILVHSVLPDDSIAARVFKAGGNGYINKGSDPADFQAAARKVAAGGRYVSPEFAETLAMSLTGEKQAQPHEQLSPREYQVMQLIAEGKTPGQIAETIGCNVNTISTYRARILKKLGLKTSMDIMRYALTRRLVNF